MQQQGGGLSVFTAPGTTHWSWVVLQCRFMNACMGSSPRYTEYMLCTICWQTMMMIFQVCCRVHYTCRCIMHKVHLHVHNTLYQVHGWLTWIVEKHSLRSTVQSRTGQGLGAFWARRARHEATPRLGHSSSPLKRACRHAQQKTCPQGVDTGPSSTLRQSPQARPAWHRTAPTRVTGRSVAGYLERRLQHTRTFSSVIADTACTGATGCPE